MSRPCKNSQNRIEHTARAQSLRVGIAGGLMIAGAVAVMTLASVDLSKRVTTAAHAVETSVTHYARPPVAAPQTHAALAPAAPALHDPIVGITRVAVADIRLLLEDPAIREFIGPSENAWDFTAPNGVPGFGPISPPAEPRPYLAGTAK